MGSLEKLDGKKGTGQEAIAIVGMSCLFPMAPGLAQFFGNIISGKDCIREPNENEWDLIRYQSPTGSDFKKIYCVRGGFVTELSDFDPLKYGVMPKAVTGADPDQFLALRVACEAMADAGYDNLPTSIERGEVILGRTSAPGQGAMTMIQQGQTVDQMIALVQKLHPEISEDDVRHLSELLHGSLPPTNSDTVPGVMPNLLAGRIAQRLGFKGKNLLLDAACASSLIAVETAVHDLRSGVADVALAGGIHINSFACFYQMFCSLTALSPNQAIRPFDDAADGTILGEGIGAIVLKRYSEAVENGDRIYAIIRGVGSSSDGHGTSLLAPSHEGESLAIRRAFEDAGVSPKTVGLIEAHGTGTPAGDLAELQAVGETYGADTNAAGWIALGSVKSMIGHTQAASGMAGIIKAALSLYHRVLPPTLNVTKGSTAANWSKHPCHVSTQTRPWIHPKVHPSIEASGENHLKTTAEPRRAAVSAFGFGGVNAHVILEEHDDIKESERPALLRDWDTELFAFDEPSTEALEFTIQNLLTSLTAHPHLALREIAYSVSCGKALKGNTQKNKRTRLAIIATSKIDLAEKLQVALSSLNAGKPPEGIINQDICFTGQDAIAKGQLAFVLPGLGAAYPNMLKDLCMHFPDVRMSFDYIDQMSLTNSHADKQSLPLSELHQLLPSTQLFMTPKPGRPAAQITTALLASMDSAVVTVLLAEWSLYSLLKKLGVTPSSVVGVSTGEFAALLINGAADVLETAPVFYRLSTSVAKAVPISELAKLRSIKVSADWHTVEPLIKHLPGKVYLGADLSPKQMLLSGTIEAIVAAKNEIDKAGIEVFPLPIAIPYHTPLVEGKVNASDAAVKGVTVNKPNITTWACSLIDKYPDDTEAIRKITTELFTRPIYFKKTIEAMHAEGTSIFLEVGPRGGMTSIVDEVLEGKNHLAIAANLQNESGITQLNRALALLHCYGQDLNLAYLYERRATIVDLNSTKVERKSSSMRLSLKYPEITLKDKPNLPSIEQAQYSNQYQSANFPVDQNEPSYFDDADFPPITEAERRELKELQLQQQNELNQIPQPDPFAVIDEVMENYIKTLESFHTNIMAVQSQIFSQFFSDNPPEDSPKLISYDPGEGANSGHDSDADRQAPAGFTRTPQLMPSQFQPTADLFSRLPAFMEMSSVVNCSADEIEILLPLTLDSHRYLFDHAIGGTVRSSTGIDERVHLLPLTVAIEMMCEAASLVSPGLIVTGVESIRAMRRIRVGQEGVWLLVFAKREGERVTTGVKVVRQDEWLSLAGAGDHFTGQHRLATADMTASVMVGKNRLQARSKATQPADGRAPTISTEQLYAQGNMFHGPRMQSVKKIESVGKREISGIVTSRNADHWFGQNMPYNARTEPAFIADPLLLDNSTQLVLFHLYEHSEKAIALLPFFVQSLTLYQPLNLLRGDVRVHARLRSITERGTEADVEIVSLDGELLAKFESINSRRIALSDQLNDFIANPAEKLLSHAVPGIDFSQEPKEIALVNSSEIPDDDTVLSWLSDYVLTSVEQQFLNDAFTDRVRKKDWLLGRIAAKDAVRSLYKRIYGTSLPPLEFSVLSSQNHAPYVQSYFLQSKGISTQVSITHKGGRAIALARILTGPGVPCFGVGVDYEPYAEKDQDLEALILNEQELPLLNGLNVKERSRLITQIWCAKECAAKTMGTGLGGDARKWVFSDLTSVGGGTAFANVVSPYEVVGSITLVSISLQDTLDGVVATAQL